MLFSREKAKTGPSYKVQGRGTAFPKSPLQEVWAAGKVAPGASPLGAPEPPLVSAST